MSQDNMPELPEYSTDNPSPDYFGNPCAFTAEDMHVYARQYAEQRVAAEREACAVAIEDAWWPAWAERGDEREVFAAAIRARSGAQDEGRTTP